MSTRVTAVVLAYGDEPWVEACVEALLRSRGVVVDVVIVDNCCTTGAPDRIEGREGTTVLRPGRNLGFAGGCNAGAGAARGEVLALVNADALVDEDALARLAAVALEPGVGIASASIRLAATPDLMNSAGNPLHLSGLSWAGGYGEPATEHAVRREVLGASGAGLALRRELWHELGGFWEPYFAYLEDTELSLRCWQRGLSVVYVPDAVVHHRYEFSRNALKMHLLERNRLVLLLTAFERRTLLALLPLLLVVEVATWVLAAAQRRLRGKAGAWIWLLGHRDVVLVRRRLLQTERTVSDDDVLPRLALRISDEAAMNIPGTRLLDALLQAYWAVARRVLARGSRSSTSTAR